MPAKVKRTVKDLTVRLDIFVSQRGRHINAIMGGRVMQTAPVTPRLKRLTILEIASDKRQAESVYNRRLVTAGEDHLA